MGRNDCIGATGGGWQGVSKGLLIFSDQTLGDPTAWGGLESLALKALQTLAQAVNEFLAVHIKMNANGCAGGLLRHAAPLAAFVASRIA